MGDKDRPVVELGQREFLDAPRRPLPEILFAITKMFVPVIYSCWDFEFVEQIAEHLFNCCPSTGDMHFVQVKLLLAVPFNFSGKWQ